MEVQRNPLDSRGFVGHPYILRSNMLGLRRGGHQNPDPNKDINPLTLINAIDE